MLTQSLPHIIISLLTLIWFILYFIISYLCFIILSALYNYINDKNYQTIASYFVNILFPENSKHFLVLVSIKWKKSILLLFDMS